MNSTSETGVTRNEGRFEADNVYSLEEGAGNSLSSGRTQKRRHGQVIGSYSDEEADGRDSQDDVLAGELSVDRGERVELVLEQVRVLGVEEAVGFTHNPKSKTMRIEGGWKGGRTAGCKEIKEHKLHFAV